MSNVKGSALWARYQWVLEHHGEEGIERLLDELNPQTADICRSNLLKSRWYPFEAFVDLIETTDRVWGKGDLALVNELARYAADKNLKTIYRLFYKVGNVKWILERAARLWKVNYDSGVLTMTPSVGNEVAITIEGFDTPHRAHCLSVFGWAQRSIELSGGNAAVIDELKCRVNGDEACTCRFAWR